MNPTRKYRNPYGDRNPYSSKEAYEAFEKLPSWKLEMLNRQRYLRERGMVMPKGGIPLDDVVCRLCQSEIVMSTNGIPHQVRCARGHQYTPKWQNTHGVGLSSKPRNAEVYSPPASPWYADQMANPDMRCECGSTYAMHNGVDLVTLLCHQEQEEDFLVHFSLKIS